jgi:hypothetical protein
MKPFILLGGILAVLLSAFAGEPVLLWEMNGLSSPESVVLDRARNQLYVSNMGSYGPAATKGDGFVSRASVDGKLLEAEWVKGLEDPKGLALVGDRLYVGDVDALVEIDITKGVILARYAPTDGPGDFNDCTADSEGNVYVCSGRLLTVFRLHHGEFAPWVKLDRSQTGGINGLLAEKNRLLLGGWTVKDADGAEQLGHISTVDFQTLKVGRIGTKPICHIDGLEPDGRGGYTATDWMTGDVLQVSANGEPEPLMKLHPGSADHTYLRDEGVMIIPLMKDNMLRAYRWTPDGS